MQTFGHHRRGFSWIAFVALLALTFGPTLSRGLAAARDGSAWADICTLQSAKQGTDRAKGDRAASIHLDHCGLCGLAGQAVLFATAVPLPAPIHSSVALPQPAWPVPPPTAWPTPPSRAPPTLPI